MKKDDFRPFDDVADSMAAAASRLGVPLEAVKMAKRAGCTAFRGSRIHLGELATSASSREGANHVGRSHNYFGGGCDDYS